MASGGQVLSARPGPRDVLVTGGAGFIGANLCRALRESPSVDRIVVLDDLSTGSAENLTSVADLELVEGSILDEDLVDKLVANAGSVVHLAARPSVSRSLEDPMTTHEVNATGTLRVLEAARKGGSCPVIVASSSSVYGSGRPLPVSEDVAPAPRSPYAASKLAAESYAFAYFRSLGLSGLVFRFFNVFGPFQRADHAYAAVVPAFVAAAIKGEPLPLHGDGHQTRDFTYVGSVVSVLVRAVEDSVSFDGPVNLAFGGRHSLLELVSLLEDAMGTALEVRHAPTREGDVRDSQADQSRLRSLFPSAEPVQIEEGLKATVQWARSTGHVSPVAHAE